MLINVPNKCLKVTSQILVGFEWGTEWPERCTVWHCVLHEAKWNRHRVA